MSRRLAFIHWALHIISWFRCFLKYNVVVYPHNLMFEKESLLRYNLYNVGRLFSVQTSVLILSVNIKIKPYSSAVIHLT